MCGLTGMARVGGGDLSVRDEVLLERMTRAVGHRGPDGERLFRDGPVAMGFRRLALVGPADGDQPLFSQDRQQVLIANGEVYNHRELEAGPLAGVPMRTKSDCEVLPHLYAQRGHRFLDDVAGMYAIALWDRAAGRLVFARDRFGVKPLYYTRAGDTVLFASEIKALFQHPGCRRELDWDGALADQSMTAAPYLSHEPVNTWFHGIETVPAGGIVTIDLTTGHTEHRTYWELPGFDGDNDASDEELIRAYRELLAASVADCTGADAEVGLFLSGGVDSASVAALAARQGTTIHTFSVLNAATLANGDAEHGHRVARALGMPNHQLVFEPDRIPGTEEWKRLLWLLETPLCNAEQYYKYELYRYAKHVRPELRGMLLGQASDEYNGGYSTTITRGDGWAGFEVGVRDLARASALHGLPALASWWEHGELLAEDLLRDGAGRRAADPYPGYVAWKHRDVQQYNCWHEDRTAAGNGVEARVPFLDHRVIELLATIPAGRRASLLWDKRILRDGVRDLLPAFVADRPKVSFFYGEGAGFTHRAMVRMLRQDGDALLEEALASPGARRHLRPDALRGMLRGLAGEMEPFGVEFLLRLVNLGLLDQMAAEPPVPPVDAPPVKILSAAPITDWDQDAPGLTAAMHRCPEPRADDVVALAPDVLLVAEPADPDTLYLAVGGQFEYVATASAAPEWCAFLRAVDGRRRIGEVLTEAGVTHASVATELWDALDAGVLTATAGALTTTQGAGR
ncbi:asparagine synthase (glutamine-hydrolyzing) [Actinoallomurus bryophytorum]|uniref:asparagine synthase (glutamine-hydrolyzing) n=1 Tax=Actinoallomurus bryophytorum TaxID=1490222 RepID=A0A543CTW5_9ACTN|nr:asparagine synthase (glutamine-hydrolyzing) [Actinoallomurus bryophytorum]TQM00544.1 asparagine synthase (glutamine-hydrolysing) [Actinoallomurus bryophytorum]